LKIADKRTKRIKNAFVRKDERYGRTTKMDHKIPSTTKKGIVPS
jgi:hypothetical protein